MSFVAAPRPRAPPPRLALPGAVEFALRGRALPPEAVAALVYAAPPPPLQSPEPSTAFGSMAAAAPASYDEVAGMAEAKRDDDDEGLGDGRPRGQLPGRPTAAAGGGAAPCPAADAREAAV